MLEAHPLPEHMSFSQFESLLDCGWKYALGRKYKIPERPGWALVGGKSIHLATELVDHMLETGSLPPEDVRQTSQPHVVKSPLENEEPDGKLTTGDTPRPMLALRSDSMSQLLREVVGQIDWREVDPEGPPGQEVFEVWNLAFSSEILSEMASNKTFADPKDWKASGRTSKALPDGEGVRWWTGHGPLQLQQYLNWRATSGWQLAFFKGKPMIELDVQSEIRGIALQGYIDRIMLDPDGQPFVVDLKSGSSEPNDSTQLGLYKVLLESLGLPAPVLGAYFMSRDGKMGKPRDLRRFTPDYFEYQFGGVKAQRDRGELIANPRSQYCYSCPFSEYCFAKAGNKSDQVPLPWVDRSNVVNLPQPRVRGSA
jgi:hypothetical protein